MKGKIMLLSPDSIIKHVESGELVHFIMKDPDDEDIIMDFGCRDLSLGGQISSFNIQKVTCPYCLKILKVLSVISMTFHSP
jgi:hypothetical protein